MPGRGNAGSSCAPSRSLTLVECGPVHTSFLANLQCPDPESSEMRGLDAETQGLYRRYLWHCQSIFRDTAQEVEEVLPVSHRGAGPVAGAPGEGSASYAEAAPALRLPEHLRLTGQAAPTAFPARAVCFLSTRTKIQQTTYILQRG